MNKENVNQAGYVSAEVVSAMLGLPIKFIRQLADEKRVPFLVVGKRMRFNPIAVQSAIGKLARQGAVNE